MKTTMVTTFLLLAVSSVVFVTQIESLALSIYVAGFPYASRHNGKFTMTDFQYNGKPVWANGRWSIYFRKSGYKANRWVLDFNDVGEEWSGTVAWSESNANEPFITAWGNNGAVSRYSAIKVAKSAYSYRTTGTYALKSHYKGWPVYQLNYGSSMQSVYRRSGGYAKNAWVLDLNSINDEWSGTVDYSSKGIDPTAVSWKSGTFST